MTNLIQIMQWMNVKFLGTVKDRKSFPFQFVDVNETGTKSHNKRLIVQTYGMRIDFVARMRSSTGSSNNVQASVLRHGAGKTRGACIVTNIPQCLRDTWVYETTTNAITCVPQGVMPDPLPSTTTTNNDMIAHAWGVFCAGITVASRGQKTNCWRVGRLF